MFLVTAVGVPFNSVLQFSLGGLHVSGSSIAAARGSQPVSKTIDCN
jgi:hypothetical protein